MHATLKNYRQAPRKVRLLADLVRGRTVADALVQLSAADKKAAEPMEKLIKSAVANAKQQGVAGDANQLVIDTITVDKGLTLHRAMPRAFSRATPVRKMTSHVHVRLAEPQAHSTEAA